MAVEEKKLQFTCAHCGLELTVPLAMAGVSGPCPGCGEQITSPRAATPDRGGLVSRGVVLASGAGSRGDRSGAGYPGSRSHGSRRIPAHRDRPEVMPGPGSRGLAPGRGREPRRSVRPDTGLSERYAQRKEVRDLIRISIAVLATLAVVAVVVAIVQQG